jgi:hypothetical protein
MARFVFIALLLPIIGVAQCISIEDAPNNIGKKTCVTGKVLKVEQSEESGTFFLDFCPDYNQCPFSVVVLPIDLQEVGDVRLLEGKHIEITGKIKQWHGRVEIVLKHMAQLHGADVPKLPSIPKAYDTARRGNFSAGEFKGTRTTKRTHRRPSQPSPDEIDME